MATHGFVLWFTGLSGSGKSTLAAMVAAELRARGVHVETLDGDEIRKQLSRGLGFSREDRDENIRRIGFAAKLVSRSGACAIAAAISPYRGVRDEIRRSVDRFVEVYTECPVPVLAERDPKGLYKKALAGVIKNFTGVDDPYEAPSNPEVHLYTDRESPEQSLTKILARLESLGFIPSSDASPGDAKNQISALPLAHGQELVDCFARARPVHDASPGALAEIELDEASYADLAGIACGAYSPLRGFMTSKDYLRVVREGRLEQGLPWAFPITVGVPERRAPEFASNRTALLRSRGRTVGTLHVAEIFRPDPDAEAERGGRSVCVGGEVQCLETSEALLSGGFPLPRRVRDDFVHRGFRHVTAIRADTPPFAPDEHVARAALEFSDAVIVLCAPDTRHGIPADVNVRCYEALFGRYFARERARAVPYRWSKQGPAHRSILHDAIVAKNFGASRLVVAADGAGTPRQPRGELAELGIEVVSIDRGTWSADVGAATSRTAPAGTAPVDVAAVLEAIRGGDVAPALVRPDVAAILREHFDGRLA